jgi:hypothetical protein
MFATVVTFVLIAGPFGYSSVCDKCGASRDTTEWKFPLTDFTVFTYSTESGIDALRI